MKAIEFKVHHATSSHRRLEQSRLLSVNVNSSSVKHLSMRDLPDLFHEGDVLVVNDAGTLPSSLSGSLRKTKAPLELRLAMSLSAHRREISSWRGVLFGEGDWHTPTEKRPSPPEVFVGDV